MTCVWFIVPTSVTWSISCWHVPEVSFRDHKKGLMRSAFDLRSGEACDILTISGSARRRWEPGKEQSSLFDYLSL
jgi:hypothetical protein